MSNENIYKNVLSDAPLLSALLQYSKSNPARFHMPGHKGAAVSPLFPVFGSALGLDVTELPETDNLFEDEGAILEAEKRAARAYGVQATAFCAGGSTLCIEAMLRLAAKCGDKIICARNIHRSVVNAMALLGLEPIWVWPRSFPGSGLPGKIIPADIEAAAEAENAAAVFLTSPDYYGVISDIAGIKAVCRRHGLPLLVDNAHGAHLCCFSGLHPAALGADMCCDSAHKTLPALTGGAYLQINSPSFSRGDAKDAMTLFGSTSPSYFIMLSLDIARAWLEKDGKKAFSLLARKVAGVRAYCAKKGFFTPENVIFDPVRLTIDTASRGISGTDAGLILRQHGVSPEMCDARHLVLIPTPFNSDRDFDRLCAAIDTLPLNKAIPLPAAPLAHPARVLSLREAVMSQSVCVPVEKSAGKVAAEAKCPCPPCVPILMPGEAITRKLAEALKNYGVLNIKVIK